MAALSLKVNMHSELSCAILNVRISHKINLACLLFFAGEVKYKESFVMLTNFQYEV